MLLLQAHRLSLDIIICHRKLLHARLWLLPGCGSYPTLPGEIKGPKPWRLLPAPDFTVGSEGFVKCTRSALLLPNLSFSPSCMLISQAFLHTFSAPNSLSRSPFTDNPKIRFMNYFLYCTSIPISLLYLPLNIRGSWLLRYSKARAHAMFSSHWYKEKQGPCKVGASEEVGVWDSDQWVELWDLEPFIWLLRMTGESQKVKYKNYFINHRWALRQL